MHTVMKRVEISQLSSAELSCDVFTQNKFDDRCIMNISEVMNMHVSDFTNSWSYPEHESFHSMCFMRMKSVLQHKGNVSPNCSSGLFNVFCTAFGSFSHILLVNCHSPFLFVLGKNTDIVVIIRVHNCSIEYEKW